VWAGCEKAKSILWWQASTPLADSIHHSLSFINKH
jgi:hypothetical protein